MQNWRHITGSNLIFCYLCYGSNGKTIVKEWLYQPLREDHHCPQPGVTIHKSCSASAAAEEENDPPFLEAGISMSNEMQG